MNGIHREIAPLTDKAQTVTKMYRLAEDFSRDLDGFIVNGKRIPRMSMIEFYEYVRGIPFRRDREPVEWIGRPEVLLKASASGLDCKKKAVLLGAFFERKNIPRSRWRYVVVSRRADGEPHHVLPQIKLAGSWYNFDATYGADRPFDNKRVTSFEPMRRL